LCVAAYLGATAAVLQAWASGRARWLALAGVLAALAIFLRADMALFVAGLLAALFLFRPGWAVRLGAVLGASCLPWLALNRYAMGDFFNPQAPAVASVPLFAGFREVGLWFVPYALLNAPRVLALPLGPLALIGGTLLSAAALLAPLVARWRAVGVAAGLGLALLGASVLADTYGYRSVHGLILAAPQIVFAAWLYPERRPGAPALLAWSLAVGAAVYGGVYLARGWVAAGGLQWGPRYMLVLYPLAITAGLAGLWRTWPGLGRALRWGLAAAYLACAGVGLGFEVRGVAAANWTMAAYARARTAVQALPAQAIVTPCTWMTMVIPELYWTGRVFAQGDLERWTALARQAGLQSAAQVEMNACQNVGLDEVARLEAQWPSGLAVNPLPLEP
ncbi:MAG: hypothetical protein JNK29_04750, partial [Anaerolineales bacterium]|nr:hypothetical protein [Anaerolineales bacterium]